MESRSSSNQTKSDPGLSVVQVEVSLNETVKTQIANRYQRVPISPTDGILADANASLLACKYFVRRCRCGFRLVLVCSHGIKLHLLFSFK